MCELARSRRAEGRGEKGDSRHSLRCRRWPRERPQGRGEFQLSRFRQRTSLRRGRWQRTVSLARLGMRGGREEDASSPVLRRVKGIGPGNVSTGAPYRKG